MKGNGKGSGIFCLLDLYRQPHKGSVIFYQEGGLLKIGGDQVLCLRSKGGIKRFFQIKKGGSLIFFKEIKYVVKHSWNSC